MPVPFKETKLHGQLTFPFAIYIGIMPDWLTSFPLHWHQEFEIIYINSGEGTVFVDSKRYDCRYGDILLVPPDTIHGITQKEGTRMVYFTILFKPTLLDADQNSAFYKQYCLPIEEGLIKPPVFLTPDTKASQNLRPLIEQLTEQWQIPAQNNMLSIKTKMFRIFELIYEMAKNNPFAEKKANASSARFKPLLTYVEKNYGEAISIKQAAEICNYSESFFMKSFKTTFGTSFNSYLNEYRLEKAQDFLRHSDYNVSQVSAMCGFESLSYFIKCYKKKWGITPHSQKVQN
ncbi:MAG: AraC family transcriptional regulator [Treponema sp.]|nr:AraC family transcriptional regulator [Treponema sp.]